MNNCWQLAYLRVAEKDLQQENQYSIVALLSLPPANLADYLLVGRKVNFDLFPNCCFKRSAKGNSTKKETVTRLFGSSIWYSRTVYHPIKLLYILKKRPLLKREYVFK